MAPENPVTGRRNAYVVRRLGSRIWFEQGDSVEKGYALLARARECRFGLARIFILWNWVERAAGQWD